jgi:hypothetical protein
MMNHGFSFLSWYTDVISRQRIFTVSPESMAYKLLMVINKNDLLSACSLVVGENVKITMIGEWPCNSQSLHDSFLAYLLCSLKQDLRVCLTQISEICHGCHTMLGYTYYRTYKISLSQIESCAHRLHGAQK